MTAGILTILPMTVEKIDAGISGHGVTAFSTLRGRVAPDDPYSEFNACHYTGDSERHVRRCRRALCQELGIDHDRLIMARQTHSTCVEVVDHIPFGVESLDGVDGLVTSLRGVALAINTADCVPLMMCDCEAGVIAAVHSGWRGTVGLIAARAVEAMRDMGAEPSRIRAAMGPSICRGCFEVGEDVAERFRRDFPDDVVSAGRSERPHVDLGAAVRHTLIESGVTPDRIILPAVCPRCNPDRFFSARRLGVASGRTLSVIMLK